MNKIKTIPQQSWINIRIALLVFSPVIIVLVFNFINTYDQLYSRTGHIDDHRLSVFYLEPLLNGVFEFKSLWSDVHPAPFSASLYILSFKLEQLNFNIWKYVILVSVFLKLFFFTLVVKNNSSTSASTRVAIFVIVSCVFLSETTVIKFFWNSVGLMHIYMLLGAITLCLLPLREEYKNNTGRIVLFFIGCLVFQITFRSISTLWLISILLACSFAIWATQKKRNRSIYIQIIYAIILAIFCDKLFELLIGVTPSISEISTKDALAKALPIWVDQPLMTVKYFLTSISTTLIIPSTLKERNFSDITIQVLMITYVFTYIFSLFYTVKNITKKHSFVCFILLTFPMLSILAGMLFRFPIPLPWDATFIPRYVLIREVGSIAVFWTLIEVVNQHLINRDYIAKIMVSILVALSLGFTYTNHRSTQTAIPNAKNNLNNINRVTRFIGEHLYKFPEATLREIGIAYENKYRRPLNHPQLKVELESAKKLNRHNSIKLKAIHMWRKHELNVFSEKF